MTTEQYPSRRLDTIKKRLEDYALKRKKKYEEKPPRKTKKHRKIKLGDRFGFLTVVGFDDSDKRYSKYFCVCDCGNEGSYQSNALKGRRVLSCGCFKKSKSISGAKFGAFVVLSKLIHKKIKDHYMCKCECGKDVCISYEQLKTLDDCGCGLGGFYVEKEPTRRRTKENLAGHLFGRLRVIEKDLSKEYRDEHWTCQCICGNITSTTKSNLKNGLTKSCGCMTESFVATIVKQYFVEKYSAMLEYKVYRDEFSTHPLRFDIYVPAFNLFIEINGGQHYVETFHYHRNKDDFQNQIDRDNFKREYALSHGYFMDIDIREYDTPDKAIALLEDYVSSI